MATSSQVSEPVQRKAAETIELITPLTYVGLLLITLANLMYENLLTRIFSVTMYYNYAFVAVSTALLGMSVGAVIVYLRNKIYTPENVKHHLTINSILFSISIVVSFFLHAQIPFSFTTVSGLILTSINFVIISVPFVFGGIVVCLALTKIPGHVGKLYAADLIGAALGCIGFVIVLNLVSAPTSVVVVTLISAIGALLFAYDASQPRLIKIAAGTNLIVVAILVAQLILSGSAAAPLRIKWVKGELESPLLYEKWNSFSRVRIFGDPENPIFPFGWSLNPEKIGDKKIIQLFLDIDADASTVLTHFKGDLSEVSYLKADVTNAVHYLRPNSNVLVIGVGGGRDVLSALAFNQASVTGVEINENIVNVVNGKYGEFTGHLNQQPNVKFVTDEARSFITRSKDTFDIIQLSLIDTWAATASGAYVFTENSLYTTEAWKIFLDHLSPNGVISFSRWYIKDSPSEMYRLTALASQSLMEAGIQNPRDHIIIVRCYQVMDKKQQDIGIGTILVSKTAFTPQEISRIHEVANQFGYEVVHSSQDQVDPVFAQLTTREGFQDFIHNFQVNIAPPSDDSPFFFHMLRVKDFFHRELWNRAGLWFNGTAVYTLGTLLVTVILSTLLFIIVPILLTSRRVNIRKIPPFLVYFAAIGFGFMLVEISQIQRLTVFLGHPTYSLTTALFSLLLFSGIGSYLTENIDIHKMKKRGPIMTALLLGVLVLFGAITPLMAHAFAGESSAVRILVSVVLLSPLGLFMGMAFPLGMKVASQESGDLAPWLWGINGATSVCASVVAVIISMTFSISTAYWTGFVCYCAAALSLAWILWKRRAAV